MKIGNFGNLLRRVVTAFALLSSVPAMASRGTGCIPSSGTLAGLALVTDVNAAVAALISTNSGTSAPATDCTGVPVLGQLWVDTSTSPNTLRQYDGTQWLALGGIDSSNHVWTPPVGGGTNTLAAAATTDIGATPQAYNIISGSTTITSFGSSATLGTIHVLKFSNSLTLTYNATSLILPGAANITTAAGDTALAVYLGTGNWSVIAYTRADGTPVAPAFGTATSLASAATTDLGTVPSHNVTVTGTTGITSFGSTASVNSPLYFVKFSGALTLTYNATSMVLPTAASITTAANDTALALYLGSGNWQVVSYHTASGAALVAAVGGTALVGGTSNGVVTNNAGYVGNTGSGTLGQTLTSNGSGAQPTFKTGGRTLLNTLTPSGVAAVSDLVSFTSAYSEYDIVVENMVPATNSVACILQVQSGGSIQAASYNSSGPAASTTGAGFVTSTTYIPCSYGTAVSNSAPGVSVSIHVSNPAGTSAPKMFQGYWSHNSTSASFVSGSVGGFWGGGNGAITGIQFQFSSGNIASGTIKIYGSN